MPLDQDALNTLSGTQAAPAIPASRSHRRWWLIGIAALLLVLVAAVMMLRQPLEVSTAAAVALPADAPQPCAIVRGLDELPALLEQWRVTSDEW